MFEIKIERMNGAVRVLTVNWSYNQVRSKFMDLFLHSQPGPLQIAEIVVHATSPERLCLHLHRCGS